MRKEDVIIDLIMENSIRIEDLINVAAELSQDYKDDVLTNERALFKTQEAIKALNLAKALIEEAGKIEFDKD